MTRTQRAMDEIQIPPRTPRNERDDLTRQWKSHVKRFDALELARETLLNDHRLEIVERAVFNAERDLELYWDELAQSQST